MVIYTYIYNIEFHQLHLANLGICRSTETYHDMRDEQHGQLGKIPERNRTLWQVLVRIKHDTLW